MESYFQDIEYYIIKNIKRAKSRLLIAVAWFTSDKIGEELIKKNDLDIEIIVDDNTINRECSNIRNLLEHNIEVTFVKDLDKNYYLMHNKFCVIDNALVITGSYNWTKAAKSNDENIMISHDQKNASLYTLEFRRIKNIQFPNDSFSVSDEEANEITETIYNSLIKILKLNISNLPSGLFLSWNDDKVKNKIRAIDERIRNNFIKQAGHFVLYQDLIRKYGVQYNTQASEGEKIEARSDFVKKGIEQAAEYLHHEFQFFKLKALRKMQDNYAKLLEGNEIDKVRTEKIVRVFQYITQEKLAIAREINIVGI